MTPMKTQHDTQQHQKHESKQHQNEHQRQKQSSQHSGAARVNDLQNAITTKHNQVFLLTTSNGDILPNNHGYGVYFRDTCYLDQLELCICGHPTTSLLADAAKGAESVFELTNPHMQLPDGRTLAKERLSIRRSYTLHQQVTQRIEIRNLDQLPAPIEVSLTFNSHFTDMLVLRGFVKGPIERGTLHHPQDEGNKIVLAYDGADKHHRETVITFDPKPDSLHAGEASYQFNLQPGKTQQIEITLHLEDKAPEQNNHHTHQQQQQQHQKQTTQTGAEKHKAFDDIMAQHPTVETSNALFDRALQRSLDDLRLLCTADHDHVYVAAGVPWYVALFGRDSCITAFESLAFQPELAKSTLRILAQYQGTKHDSYRDEEPGKILHELRVGETANLHEIPMTPYYGTVDATPWFLMLLCDYIRWTGDLALYRDELHDNAERALQWIEANLGEHLTGYLSYGTRSEKGLVNQGWKDSDNGIVNSDGSLAQPPIALVEVQGYAYCALAAMAELLRQTGEADRAGQLEHEAQDLKERFNSDYWMDDAGYYAFALQRDRRPATAIASNPGHTLFTRIADEEKVEAVADRLLADDLFCGWGIRTLASTEKAYNPLDYQVGSVWPHDNALIALGLRRWGYTGYMDKVFTGIFQAATEFTHFRLPEVFDGFGRDQYSRPVNYPIACSPQAWAAGALPLLLQTALGLEPDALHKTLHIHRPHLPEWLGDVTFKGLHVSAATVDLHYERDGQTTLVAVQDRHGDLEIAIEY